MKLAASDAIPEKKNVMRRKLFLFRKLFCACPL